MKIAQIILAVAVALAGLCGPTAMSPARTHFWPADALGPDARAELAALANVCEVTLQDDGASLRLRCDAGDVRAQLADWARRHGQPLPTDRPASLVAAEAVFVENNAHRTAAAVKAELAQRPIAWICLPSPAAYEPQLNSSLAHADRPAGKLSDPLTSKSDRPRGPPRG